jgi:hypothetical protein
MWMTILCQVILGEIIYVLQDENHIVKDCQGLASHFGHELLPTLCLFSSLLNNVKVTEISPNTSKYLLLQMQIALFLTPWHLGLVSNCQPY